MKDKQGEMLRRSFAAGGLGAIAMAMASDLSAQGDPGNVQAVRDFHKALETVVAGGMDGFAKVTTDDFVVWTPGLGPTPFVGREAAYNRWVQLMKDRNGVGLRSDMHDVLFANGPYVITTRDDWRIGTDGKEAGAGSNLMGLYAVTGGKVRMWYNGGGGGNPNGKKKQ
jgi:limonene-1,2-epoxide hydrolase